MKRTTLFLAYTMLLASSCANQRVLENYQAKTPETFEMDYNACLLKAEDYVPTTGWIINDNHNRIMDICMKSKGHKTY